MNYIIDIAKSIKDALSDVSGKIQNNLSLYRDKFHIGVSDAVLSDNTIEFTLESIIDWSLSKENEDSGLSISAEIFLELLRENEHNNFIKVIITLFKSNGIILESKDFIMNQYNDDESEKTVRESIVYINEMGVILKEGLLNDYLKRS